MTEQEPSPGAIALAELADRLKLKREWLDLATAVVCEPGVSQRQHAINLGVYKGNPKYVGPYCTRVLNDPRTREYMEALKVEVSKRRGEVVTGQIEGGLVQARERAIAEAPVHQWRLACLAEVLQILTDQARVHVMDFLDTEGEPDLEKLRAAPQGLVEAYEVITTTSEEGQVTKRARIKFASPQGAAKELLAYHRGIQAPPPESPHASIIRLMTPQELDDMERIYTAARMRALASGAIETEAKPIA